MCFQQRWVLPYAAIAPQSFKDNRRQMMSLESRWRWLWLSFVLTLPLGATGGVSVPHPVSPSPANSVVDSESAFRCDRVTSAAALVVETRLAGVPAILRIPAHVSRPPIVLWHGFGPPANERSLMDALPMDDVPSIKVYLGLPLFGARAPQGGNQELGRRQAEDFAMLLFKPAVEDAAEELPSVVTQLQRRGCMLPGQRIGLFGYSAGGSAALIALIQSKVAVRAVVLVNASTGLNASVQALERLTKQPYHWTAASRELAERTDAVRHAAQIARGNPPPALLVVQGASDTVLTPQPATELHDALQPYYLKHGGASRLKLVLIKGMAHGWTDDKEAADKVDRLTRDWFDGE
jgi:predicted esterase